MSIFDWTDNELDNDELAARGNRASQILSDPVFAQALADAERQFVQEWLAGSTTPTREAAHAKMHALQEVRNQLESYVADAVVVPSRRR